MSELVENERRIVVGVDGSAGSKQALRWAARLAPTEHATIHVIGAWDIPAAAGWPAIPPSYSPKDDMTQAVAETVADVLGAERPPYLRTSVRQGHPVRVLLDASADALILVVGSRGHGGFAGLLLGSVSARVAELATCPVLVVHGDLAPAA